MADGALTIAHELVHCFIGFLTGDPGVGTPQKLAPPGYEPKAWLAAESGRTWEHRVLGGCATVVRGCATLLVPKEKGDKVPRAFIQLGKDHKIIEVDSRAVEAMVERSTLVDAKPFFLFFLFYLFFFPFGLEPPGLTAFKQGLTFPSGPSGIGCPVNKTTRSQRASHKSRC